MAKKKQEDYVGELLKSFDRWEHLKTVGGNDPCWSDGVNMGLVRNHILYYKRKIEEHLPEPYPEIYHRPTPPEVDWDYMARKEEIRENALKSLERYKSDANFRYLLNEMPRLTEKQKKEIPIANVTRYTTALEQAIAENDYVAMRRHESPEGYLDSFKRCADAVRNMPVEEKQLSLFR